MYKQLKQLREKFFDVSKNKLKSATSREIYFGKKFKNINAFSVILPKTKLKKK